MHKSIAAAFLSLVLAGSAAAGEATDLSGASRIVSVGGSITEIVYALGEERRLVGRDSTSVFPEAVLAVPDVGYMRALSPEGVLSVDPKGIIALEGSGPPEAVDVLARASVPFVTVPDRFDREGIVEKIRIVGRALGADERAAGLASSVEADLAAAEKAAKAAGSPVKVLFVLSLQGGKVLASGAGSAADGIIRMAGGVNVMGGFDGYKQVTDEAIIAARPDVILMMDRGGDHAGSNAEIAAHPALGQTPAAGSGRIVRMDGAYLLGFGPRTASAIRDLSAALHAPPATE